MDWLWWCSPGTQCIDRDPAGPMWMPLIEAWHCSGCHWFWWQGLPPIVNVCLPHMWAAPPATLNDFLFAFVVWLSLTAYVLQGLSETPKSSPHLSESHLPSGSTQPTHIKLFSMIVKVCSFFWRHSHSRHKSLHVWITGWMPFWMMR